MNGRGLKCALLYALIRIEYTKRPLEQSWSNVMVHGAAYWRASIWKHWHMFSHIFGSMLTYYRLGLAYYYLQLAYRLLSTHDDKPIAADTYEIYQCFPLFEVFTFICNGSEKTDIWMACKRSEVICNVILVYNVSPLFTCNINFICNVNFDFICNV